MEARRPIVGTEDRLSPGRGEIRLQDRGGGGAEAGDDGGVGPVELSRRQQRRSADAASHQHGLLRSIRERKTVAERPDQIEAIPFLPLCQPGRPFPPYLKDQAEDPQSRIEPGNGNRAAELIRLAQDLDKLPAEAADAIVLADSTVLYTPGAISSIWRIAACSWV